MKDDNTDVMDGETGGEWAQVAQRKFEPTGDEELGTAVVFAVADAKNVDPSDLQVPPLGKRIDLEAVQAALFGENSKGASKQDGSVKFEYADFLIEINQDGWIHLYERSGPGIAD